MAKGEHGAVVLQLVEWTLREWMASGMVIGQHEVVVT